MAHRKHEVAAFHLAIAHLPPVLRQEAVLAYGLRVYLALELLDRLNPAALEALLPRGVLSSRLHLRMHEQGLLKRAPMRPQA